MMFKCNNCGKVFAPGNGPDGIPNGIGFELKGGEVITLCAECIEKLGSMSEREQDKFIKRLTKKRQ